MNNKEILKERWDKIDNELNKYSKVFNYDVKTRIKRLIKAFNITSDSLYSYMKKADLTMFKSELQDVEAKGYLEYKINQMLKRTKIKYYEALQLLIEIAYHNTFKKNKEFEDELFTATAIITSEIVQRESYKVRKPLFRRFHLIPFPNYLLPHIMSLPLYLGYNWEEYKENMIQYNANKMYRNIVVDIQQGRLDTETGVNTGIDTSLDRYDRTFEIERKRYITALDNQVASVSNQVALWGMEKQGIKEVIFVAVMDERTTNICKSMNGQVFKINELNVYQRYARNDDEELTTYRTDGLKIGENQPALHYNCRSVLYPHR